MIILSEDFQKFIVKSGKIIERALSESIDIYTDYIGSGDGDETGLVKYFLHLQYKDFFKCLL